MPFYRYGVQILFPIYKYGGKKAKGDRIAQGVESDIPSWMTGGRSLGFSKPLSSPIEHKQQYLPHKV